MQEAPVEALVIKVARAPTTSGKYWLKYESMDYGQGMLGPSFLKALRIFGDESEG